MKYKIKQLYLNLVSFLKTNKKNVISIFILGAIAVIGVVGSYAYFTSQDSRNIISGLTANYNNSDMNINYMVENRNSSGDGIGTYTAMWNAPIKDYIYISSKSSCSNGATFTRTSDDIITITTSGKTRCEFYYDAIDMDLDSDVKVYLYKENVLTRNYEKVSDYTVDALSNEGYSFDKSKSSCEVGSVTFDYGINKVVTSATGTDTCHAYFTYYGSLEEGCLNQSMSTCFKELANLDDNLYQHTSFLEYSAGDDNYRYSGSTTEVNNYVLFNNELWRIIGIYGQTHHSVVGEDYIKIQRVESLGESAFDNGGDNRWEGYNTSISSDDADMNIYLNNTYFNSLTSIAKNQIVSSHYFLGSSSKHNDGTFGGIAFDFYTEEKLVRSVNKYNVGILYASDFMYATLPEYWYFPNYKENLSAEEEIIRNFKIDNNWFTDNDEGFVYRLINPVEDELTGIFQYNKAVGYNHSILVTPYEYRPVVYLKSSVKLIGGIGSKTDPYTIGM